MYMIQNSVSSRILVLWPKLKNGRISMPLAFVPTSTSEKKVADFGIVCKCDKSALLSTNI
jgi:hypothetical protein